MEDNFKALILGRFFEDGEISDIRGQGYFENQYTFSLLALMVDTKTWTPGVCTAQPKQWTHLNLPRVICPVLCWFARQMVGIFEMFIVPSCLTDHWG